MTPTATIKARRLTGGAVITITRADGRVHHYRVGLRRYRRMADILMMVKGSSGWAGAADFQLVCAGWSALPTHVGAWSVTTSALARRNTGARYD